MDIKGIRAGNLLIYEACTCIVLGTDITGPARLCVKAVSHDWGNETCGSGEVEGIEITPEILEENGFTMAGDAYPRLWRKELGGGRRILYHLGALAMDFENTAGRMRVPWPVRYVHQMQNACSDYGAETDFRA